jgi:NAD+ diphosphatase
MMSTSESALASKAKAIFNWHRRNTHCAKCGSPSARNSTASCRTCHKCEEVWYPSLSPVGIVLVADSLKTKLLLVRQGRHPKGMYSCIAGYVDSGNLLFFDNSP